MSEKSSRGAKEILLIMLLTICLQLLVLSACSMYGMVWRVFIGAGLSMLDAVTDIYVISNYYNLEGLRGQADAMLAMIVTNMGIQILLVIVQYKKKSWKVKVKEVLICLFFLRPIVDAFRVATIGPSHYEGSESTVNPLLEMVMNKVRLCENLWRQKHSC